MKVKNICVLLLVGMCFCFSALAETPQNYKVQVYNNTDSEIYIATAGIAGLDMMNLSHKFDCKGTHSTMCTEVQPNGNINIAPGKDYTFTIVSNVKSLVGQVFISGAINFYIVTAQRTDTENKVVLPVMVNPYAALVSTSTFDSTNETFLIGASTVSKYFVHPKYIISVTHNSESYVETTAIIVSKGVEP